MKNPIPKISLKDAIKRIEQLEREVEQWKAAKGSVFQPFSQVIDAVSKSPLPAATVTFTKPKDGVIYAVVNS